MKLETDSSVPIRIVLVDDQIVFKEAVIRLLSRAPEVEFVGESLAGEADLAYIQDRHPHVVLLSSNSRTLNMIHHLRAAMPETKIIAMPLLDSFGYRKALLAAGANECIFKTDTFTELLPAIRRVAGVPAPQ